MNKQKLCSRHKQDYMVKRVVEYDSLVKLVDSSKCDLCKLENRFNDVLDMPEFRDLRP